LGGNDSGTAATSNSRTKDFTTEGGLFNTQLAGGELTMGQTEQLAGIQGQNLTNAGAFGQQQMNDPLAQQFTQASGQFLGQAQADPFAAQQQLFNQQNQMLMPLQEQQRMAQESRLFAQGRLGSSGTLSGSAEQEALMRAQAQQTQGLFASSFNDAQAQQAQLGSMANMFGQAGIQRQGAIGAMSGEQLRQAMLIESAAQQQAKISGGIFRTSNMTGESGGPNALGAGMMAGGVDSLGGLFDSGDGRGDGPSGGNTGGGMGSPGQSGGLDN
jgi:hypothetical protein